MKMDHQRNPQPDAIAQVRALLASAASRVNQLKSAAEQALDCLSAFTGMLSQLEELAGLPDPDAVPAAAKYAAAVCRDVQALVRSLDTLGKRPAVVTVVVQ